LKSCLVTSGSEPRLALGHRVNDGGAEVQATWGAEQRPKLVAGGWWLVAGGW